MVVEQNRQQPDLDIVQVEFLTQQLREISGRSRGELFVDHFVNKGGKNTNIDWSPDELKDMVAGSMVPILANVDGELEIAAFGPMHLRTHKKSGDITPEQKLALQYGHREGLLKAVLRAQGSGQITEYQARGFASQVLNGGKADVDGVDPIDALLTLENRFNLDLTGVTSTRKTHQNHDGKGFFTTSVAGIGLASAALIAQSPEQRNKKPGVPVTLITISGIASLLLYSCAPIPEIATPNVQATAVEADRAIQSSFIKAHPEFANRELTTMRVKHGNKWTYDVVAFDATKEEEDQNPILLSADINNDGIVEQSLSIKGTKMYADLGDGRGWVELLGISYIDTNGYKTTTWYRPESGDNKLFFYFNSKDPSHIALKPASGEDNGPLILTVSESFTKVMAALAAVATSPPPPPPPPPPTPTEGPTSTPPATSTPEATAKPELSLNKILNPENVEGMSRVTLAQIQSGEVAEWALNQPENQTQITRNPDNIDIKFNVIKSVGIKHILEKPVEFKNINDLIRNIKICTILKINPSEFGLQNKDDAYIVVSIKEDKAGNKAVFSYLMGMSGLLLMQKSGYFNQPTLHTIMTADGLDPDAATDYFFEGKPDKEGDLRALGNGDKIYESQGIKRADVGDLFARLADTDLFTTNNGTDLGTINRTVWLGFLNFFSNLSD